MNILKRFLPSFGLAAAAIPAPAASVPPAPPAPFAANPPVPFPAPVPAPSAAAPAPPSFAGTGLESLAAELTSRADAARAENVLLRGQLAALQAEAAAATKAAADEIAGLKASLAAAEADRDKFKAAAERNADEIRADVRNKELAEIAASQGVPPGTTAGTGGKTADTLEGLAAALNAAKDPAEKGRIAARMKELRSGK